MATLHYNGINLDMVRVVACTRRAELDSGNTYLYTRWRIHVEAIYNPAATSYSPNLDQGVPVEAPGVIAPATDRAVRHALMQPRRKLVFTVSAPPAPGLPPQVVNPARGGLVILECPPANGADPNFTGDQDADRYTTDANNGPVPVLCNVRQAVGVKTFYVEFAVEASVNECFDGDPDPPILLSHRWAMSHDIDRYGFSTRRVVGHAVFRTDVLRRRGARPDDFREALLHPVPDNFQRENVRVTADEGNARVDYSFNDVEVSHNLLTPRVAQLEGVAIINYGLVGLRAVLGGGWGAVRSAAGSKYLSDSAGAVAGHLADMIGGVLPKIVITLVFRAWGSPRATRRHLFNVCAWAMKLKFPSGFSKTANVEYEFEAQTQFDLTGRYVEYTQTFVCGYPTRLRSSTGTSVIDMFPELMEDDISTIVTTQDTPGRAPVPDSPHRGTYLEACVAQALANPCRPPGEPLAAGSVDSPL